jgi:hypothetical protein
VVIDDVEHLEHRAVGDGHVGDVGLPTLVRQVCFEADVAALGSLVRLRDDEPACLEHPPDRRGRWCVAALEQVVADRLGAGVQAGVGQLLAQLDDRVLVPIRDPGRAVMRPPRPRLEPGLALGPIAGEELVEPGPVHPVRRGELSDRPTGPQMRLDQKPALVHRRPPPLGVSDVLTQLSSQLSPMS